MHLFSWLWGLLKVIFTAKSAVQVGSANESIGTSTFAAGTSGNTVGNNVLQVLNFPQPRVEPDVLSRGKPSPQLSLEYDAIRHYTKHSHGAVEIAVTLRNVGGAPATEVQVKLDSLVPKKNKESALPYSTQFSHCPLQAVRELPFFSVPPDGAVQIKVVRAEKGADFFLVDGYDVAGQLATFRTPASQYELDIVATCREGGAARSRFVANQKTNGELTFRKVD